MNEAEQIRDEALARFRELAGPKYDAGQAEHGGLITDRDLLAEMERECIDMWFYIQAERRKRQGPRSVDAQGFVNIRML